MSRSLNTNTNRRCHGNHHNNRLKCMICYDYSYRQGVSLLLLRTNSHLGTARLLQPKSQESPIFQHREHLLPAPKFMFLSLNAPKSFSRARLTRPIAELLDGWTLPLMGPNAHRSPSISDVSSLVCYLC